MAKDQSRDAAFEIAFFESVLRRDPASTDVVELLGGLYTRVGRIADGLKMDRRLVKLQPANATAHYNLACSLALTRRRVAALRSLREAVNLGYRDPATIDPADYADREDEGILYVPKAGEMLYHLKQRPAWAREM